MSILTCTVPVSAAAAAAGLLDSLAVGIPWNAAELQQIKQQQQQGQQQGQHSMG
jgi:hypothetical protein